VNNSDSMGKDKNTENHNNNSVDYNQKYRNLPYIGVIE